MSYICVVYALKGSVYFYSPTIRIRANRHIIMSHRYIEKANCKAGVLLCIKDCTNKTTYSVLIYLVFFNNVSLYTKVTPLVPPSHSVFLEPLSGRLFAPI